MVPANESTTKGPQQVLRIPQRYKILDKGLPSFEVRVRTLLSNGHLSKIVVGNRGNS